MSAQELDRFQIIKKLIGKHIDGTEAANLLRLSIRQVKRLKANVIKSGPAGLIHGSRGRESHNKIDNDEKKKIIELLRKRYHDFGPTFANEKLFENHGIVHDSKTIRQIMIDEELWKPRTKKKASAHRAWRERRSCYGEMIQFDGSYEHWFENRNDTAEVCLLAGVDDATGKLVFLKFAEHEGVFPVFGFWTEYLIRNGKPRSIYLDKFSTYNINHRLAKENGDTLTQFERAASELKIELIKANSPQAKGRVERLFETLQDRLIKELRLKNISSVDEANIFLEKTFIPKFNAKFSVEPRNKTNLHQKLNQKESRRLQGIFSRQKERTILNDFTFSFKKQWYQLAKEQPATICKKDTVIVEERLDKTIHIRLRGKYLNYKLLPKRPEKNQTGPNKMPWILPASKAHTPPPNHPWRHAFYTNSLTKQNIKV
ncbi:ISNCY family transposase [Patescibacteria group bacterium]|nr:ISNCY family transposase [Patescibacteria group bacterium]MBU1613494.1 ISNCY family transposase [Patescibacteria group bacterium]